MPTEKATTRYKAILRRQIQNPTSKPIKMMEINPIAPSGQAVAGIPEGQEIRQRHQLKEQAHNQNIEKN